MPVVALLGGNGGIQSLAVVIRALATDSVPGHRAAGIVARQAGIGMAEGLALAAIAGGLTLVLTSQGVFTSNSPPLRVATVVGIGALANLTVATASGSAIPLALRRLGFDPALASSIFLTLITDLVGFGGFLLVAAALL